MIVSSLIIKCAKEEADALIKRLSAPSFKADLEFYHKEDYKASSALIFILMSEYLDEELATFRAIQGEPGVASVELNFTCDEADLDADFDTIGDNVLASLEDIDSKEYGGDAKVWLRRYKEARLAKK